MKYFLGFLTLVSNIFYFQACLYASIISLEHPCGDL